MIETLKVIVPIVAIGAVLCFALSRGYDGAILATGLAASKRSASGID